MFSGLLVWKLKLCVGLFICGEDMFRFSNIFDIFLMLCVVSVLCIEVKLLCMIEKCVFLMFCVVLIVFGFLLNVISCVVGVSCVSIVWLWLLCLNVLLMYMLFGCVMSDLIVLFNSIVWCCNLFFIVGVFVIVIRMWNFLVCWVCFVLLLFVFLCCRFVNFIVWSDYLFLIIWFFFLVWLLCVVWVIWEFGLCCWDWCLLYCWEKFVVISVCLLVMWWFWCGIFFIWGVEIVIGSCLGVWL